MAIGTTNRGTARPIIAWWDAFTTLDSKVGGLLLRPYLEQLNAPEGPCPFEPVTTRMRMTTTIKNQNISAPPCWIGVDVSKTELQIHAGRKSVKLPEQVVYGKAGLNTITRLLLKLERPHVVFEASGGYDLALLEKLQASGIACSRVNPRHVRNYAKAKGLLAKTDKIDAMLLADYGATMRPAITPEADPALANLAALIAYRRHLVEALSQERMQMEHPKPPCILVMIKSRIKALESQIQKLDESIASHVSGEPSLNRAVTALSAVKGVGSLSAAALLAAMPELGTINRNQAAALAGVAPFNRDSGSLRGTRRIHGGRPEVRQALYMAAVSASRHNEILRVAYQTMLNRGKPKKVALVALMRKLLICLNSIMAKILRESNAPILSPC